MARSKAGHSPSPSPQPPWSNNQVQITVTPTDDSGKWTTRNIYRSVNSPPGNTNFYLVGSVSNTTDATATITDNLSDADLIQQNETNKTPPLNMNGPAASGQTPLSELLSYDGTTYNPLFPSAGTLQFTGSKGGVTLTTKDFDTTSKTGANWPLSSSRPWESRPLRATPTIRSLTIPRPASPPASPSRLTGNCRSSATTAPVTPSTWAYPASR